MLVGIGGARQALRGRARLLGTSENSSEGCSGIACHGVGQPAAAEASVAAAEERRRLLQRR